MAETRLELLEALTSRGYQHAPAVLRTRAGGLVFADGDACCWLMEYVPQDVSVGLSPDAGEWAELGAAAGALNLFRDDTVQFGVPVRAALQEMVAWVRGKSFEADYVELLQGLSYLADLPATGVIHGEVNALNAARHADGSVVLLDWDDVGLGPVALEYGQPLVKVFIDVNQLAVHEDAARAFYGAYVGAGGEVDATLAFDMGLFSALRYMRFADTDRRWQRVQWACEHKERVCAVLP